jgi:16S rRNA processing protein RimM
VTVVLSRQDGPDRSFRVESARRHKPFVLVKLEGVAGRSEAQELVGSALRVRKGDLPPLAEGEFYYHDLIGAEVSTTGGESVGTVTAIFPTGSNDVWVVRRGNSEYLIPVVEGIVRELDIEGKRAIIDPPEGLLA